LIVIKVGLVEKIWNIITDLANKITWATITTQPVVTSPAQPTAATTTAAVQTTTLPPATTTSAGTTTATMIAAVAPAIVGHHLVLAIAATAVRVGTTLVPMPHQLLLVELLEAQSVASLDWYY